MASFSLLTHTPTHTTTTTTGICLLAAMDETGPSSAQPYVCISLPIYEVLTYTAHREWSLPESFQMTRRGMWREVCLLDDVAASESGLAGFLREGRESWGRHTERQRKQELTETSSYLLHFTSFSVWIYWGRLGVWVWFLAQGKIAFLWYLPHFRLSDAHVWYNKVL